MQNNKKKGRKAYSEEGEEMWEERGGKGKETEERGVKEGEEGGKGIGAVAKRRGEGEKEGEGRKREAALKFLHAHFVHGHKGTRRRLYTQQLATIEKRGWKEEERKGKRRKKKGYKEKRVRTTSNM